MSPHARARLSYQPALDGVRAVAVVAVMVFHGGLTWLPGGYLGVDLFFVLSGYLITTLLLREFEGSDRIALRQFWIRRVRRLFPALALVLVAVALYGALAAPSLTRDGLRWDGLASLFYVANWRFVFSHQGYFAGFDVPSPLRHVWSLAVEEQWYLLWPPLLLVLLRWFRGRVGRLLFVAVPLTLASAAWMAWIDVATGGADDAVRSYYGTDTHAQVILVGAVLAIVLHRWPVTSRPGRAAVQWLGVGGAALCVAFFAFVHGTDRWMYQGGYLAFALGGAAVIAAVMMRRSTLLKGTLGASPLAWIGRVSYGLYLWHWPVNVYLNPERVQFSEIDAGVVHIGPDVQLFALRTVVALAITTASYYLVELPIRTGRLRLPQPARLVGGTVAALVLVVTLVPSIGPTGNQRQQVNTAAPGAKRTASASTLPPVPVSVPPPSAPPVVLPPVPTTRDVRVMVVGDSAGWTLAWGVRPPEGIDLSDYALIGCGVTSSLPIVNGQPTEGLTKCHKWRQYWLTGIKVEQPDVIVVSSGAWEIYDQELNGKRYEVFSDEYRHYLEKQLQADVDMVARASGARIVFLDTPCMRERDFGLGGADSPRNDPEKIEWYEDIVEGVVERNPGRATMLPISEWLCPNGEFLERRNGTVLRPDGVHYSQASAELTWEWLAPQLIQLARQPSNQVGPLPEQGSQQAASPAAPP